MVVEEVVVVVVVALEVEEVEVVVLEVEEVVVVVVLERAHHQGLVHHPSTSLFPPISPSRLPPEPNPPVKLYSTVGARGPITMVTRMVTMATCTTTTRPTILHL